MVDKSIYLAGPITGLTYQAARHGWREEFAGTVGKYVPSWHHAWCYSPMRAKEFLSAVQCLDGDADVLNAIGNPFATARGIVTRDHNDVKNCDGMVACFLGAERASIGTAIEFGFAFAYKKPVVMVVEPGNIHNHVMLRDIAGYVVPTLDDAARIMASILFPGV